MMSTMSLRGPRASVVAMITLALVSAPGVRAEPTEGAPAATFVALGAGAEVMPKWLGSNHYKTQAIPYFNFNWQDRIELSTTDGLTVDLLHQQPWHAGLIGTMMWGRSQKDLGDLARSVATLNNTMQVGTYLDYDFSKSLTIGLRWRHDIQKTGSAFIDVSADLDLPAPGPIEHSIKFNAEFMNAAAMQRNFGTSAEAAATPGLSAYAPGSGLESTSLTYQAFIPTSQSTGFVLGAAWSVLASGASDSPLVRNFGSRYQRGYMAAFTAHF